ncbi:MAG: succinate dehydrogenase flavoprotein subunit, partial [Gammaproteobacteria bacterium]|nr:succinate dehydrogenase flavoprotein subunit [Gammaproteobacteria bacterium]
SVHGANRLGGNSLLDIVVFGRAAGNDIKKYLKTNRHHRLIDEESVEQALAHLKRWDEPVGDGSESVNELHAELQKTMEDYCSVFRTEEILQQGLDKVLSLEQRMKNVRIQDQSKVFNTARIEAMELENLVDLAVATVKSALERKESRGAHSRIDFPDRDDVSWLKHSLYYKENHRMDYKPVTLKPISVDSFPPKPRVY